MILRLLSISALAIAVAASPALAAKGNKPAKGQRGQKAGMVLARFDRDHNGTIDGEEVARLEGAFAALSALDTDHDGKLSDSEVAAAKVPVRAAGKGAGKAGKGAGKRAGKRGAAPAPATTPSTTTPAANQ